MKINDSNAIVTGSARGIGRKIAEALLSQGAYVAFVDILADQLKKTTEELSQFGEKILPIVCDITQADQVDKMVEKVHNKFGSIDILVNNAGTFSYIGPVWEADVDKWFKDIKVNLYGSFLVCRSVARLMIERKNGYIINIVSSGGVGDPHPYSTSYACSKTGLMRLTEGLAKEAENYGIKVFAVAPPAILTEMTKFIMNDEGGKKWRPGFNKIFEEGHDSPPEKVAELILKLLSGKADKLTGRYFPVSQNFDEIIARTDEIISKDLLTLRIRS
ncbi:TPA: SDR family oxidoreductase [Candidatus Poribacteria bacterium]|nr:SDR family oxidoreductase [Candidatus Poribacteria bacterium]